MKTNPRSQRGGGFIVSCRILLIHLLLLAGIVLVGIQLPASAHDPATHMVLMHRSTSKAMLPPVAIAFNEEQRGLMLEGSHDEDKIVDWNVARMKHHFYRPIDNKGSAGFRTARQRSGELWEDMASAFERGHLYGGDRVGAWHFFGRISHLLQDMTAPLHVLEKFHVPPLKCRYEWWYKDRASSIPSDNLPPLFSDSPLPPEAIAHLDPFTVQRLQHWFNSNASSNQGPIGCPNKNHDDVRGYMEALSWITYMRATVWGEMVFGEPTWFYWNDLATTHHTTPTDFSDGHVEAQQNALHNMFPGKIRWRVSGTDNRFEIEDEQGDVFHWKRWTWFDEWHAADWAQGRMDGSKLVGGYDHDSKNARTTGRFWFDPRHFDGDEFYPKAYPDGTVMDGNIFEYHAESLFPLAVRYNAGLLGLAHRRVTVRTESGSAGTPGHDGFRWNRHDNFGNPGTAYFSADSSGNEYFFVAKREVGLAAPREDHVGRPFGHWLRDGEFFSDLREIMINTGHNPIPAGGETYTAVFLSLLPPADGITATKGALDFGVRVVVNPVEGATGYELWRHTSNDLSEAVRLGTARSNRLTDWDAVPGVTYHYWVRAMDAYGSGIMSGSDSGWRAFAPPANVTTSKGTYHDRVLITWTSVDETAYYNILRHTSDDVEAAVPLLGKVWQRELQFADATAAAEQTYYYWVVAGRGQSGIRAGEAGGPDTGFIGSGSAWWPQTDLPAFDPDGGAYATTTGFLSVTVSCPTSPVVIRYTLDGSEPTTSSSSVASGEQVKVPVPGTLRAKAWHVGGWITYLPSGVKTATYTAASHVEVPVFSPDGGNRIGDEVKVMVTCDTVGAVIRYTLDGSEPHRFSPSISSGEVVMVPVPGTLKANAWMTGKMEFTMNPSATRNASYTAAPTVMTPVFSADSGAYPGDHLEVLIGCKTPDATIRYTLDGRDPTIFSPIVEADGVVLVPLDGGFDTITVLKAKAWKFERYGNRLFETMNSSVVRSAELTALPPVPPPVFDPPGSPRTSTTVDVHITHEEPAAIFRYTLDGTEPSADSTLWSPGDAVIVVPVPGEIRARAWVDMGTGQLISSETASATFATDSSGDGIEDGWWEQHGFDPNDPPDAGSIADESGLTYQEKWVAGLIPGDPGSVLRIQGFGIDEAPGGWKLVSIMLMSTPGRQYTLQATDDLVTWIDIDGPVVATGNETSFDEIIRPGHPTRFYRVRVDYHAGSSE